VAKTSRTKKQGTDQQVIAGIKADLLQSTTSMPLGGTSYTPASLMAFVQSRIDAGNEVVTAKAAWQAAATRYKGIDKEANVVLRDFKGFVVGTYGEASPRLADFGFTARKYTPLTPEQKVAAAQKRAATRKARGTMGPKAKLKITGETAAAEAAANAAGVQASNAAATPPGKS
jgi:hypothetical protein